VSDSKITHFENKLNLDRTSELHQLLIKFAVASFQQNLGQSTWPWPFPSTLEPSKPADTLVKFIF